MNETVEPTNAELRTEVAALRREIQAMREERHVTQVVADDDEPAHATRRGLLRLAGATAAGAVASAALAGRAAADTGYVNNGLGSGNTVVGDVVRQQLNGPRASEVGFLFATVTSPLYTSNVQGPSGAALGGFAVDGATPAGVVGTSSAAGGWGVRGHASGADSVGVEGRGTTGLSGFSTTGNLGVSGTSPAGTGVAGTGGSAGVIGVCPNPSGTGVVAAGGARALSAISSMVGVEAQGGRGALRLLSSSETAPPARTTRYEKGTLEVDGFSDGRLDGVATLWFCTEAGEPGRWVKVAGPGTAGAFHPIAPGRVYDSREALPTPGPLSGGQNRTISVADKRNPTGGAVTTADFVPAGATAVAANITVVSVSGGGFLTVNPGGTTEVTASTINWSGPDQAIANGVILALNTNRELTIVAGGGTTHVVVDITGYWL